MGEGVSTVSKGSRSRGSERIQNASPSAGSVDLDSRKFKSAVTRAHNYTDDNFHGEARMTLARAFGYNDLEKQYRQINKEHDDVGYLNQDLSDRRNKLDDEMEKRIKKQYGDKGIKAYNRGLS